MSDDVIEVVNTGKRKRGSKSASVVDNCTATQEEIKEIIRNSYKWFNYPIVKTDEECADRLNEYFDECARTGEIPTVEKMCLALGTVRRTVWDWEQGTLGASRANMIKKAKEILSSMDAELVQKGKIPQITYIFRAKNFYGLSDKTEIEVHTHQPLGDQLTPDEILKKVEQDIPIDVDYTEE